MCPAKFTPSVQHESFSSHAERICAMMSELAEAQQKLATRNFQMQRGVILMKLCMCVPLVTGHG